MTESAGGTLALSLDGPDNQRQRPLMSLVVPTYNVAPYLPDFLDSLDRELASAPDVEVLFVIDGATDDSADMVNAWVDARDLRVTVIEQENQGLCGARNTGMAYATGVWISFPDPDDILGEGYIDAVRRIVTSPSIEDVTVVATNLVTYDDATLSIMDRHPLRWKFRRGERVISLDERPDFVHLSAASSFIRLDDVRASDLVFESRVRPSFEDAVLIGRFLLRHESPKIATAPTARYLYRQRADGNSMVQAGWSRAEKYDDLLRFGYLSLLEDAAHRGSVPRWVQNTVLYDLSWTFKQDSAMHSPTAALTPRQTERFLELVEQVFAFIDAEAIAEYGTSWLPDDLRAAWLALKGALPGLLQVGPVDKDQDATRVTFYIQPDCAKHDLEYRSGTELVAPLVEKYRTVEYFGHVYAKEVIAWVPGTSRVTALADEDGSPADLLDAHDVMPVAHSSQYTVASALRNAVRYAVSDRKLFRQKVERFVNRYRLTSSSGSDLANTTAVPSNEANVAYRDCWLLIDRDTEAHDNAEHFYRYLRENHPEINAWFVLSRKSPDWVRLWREGFRLIAHGSPEHTKALRHCIELVSSQLDHYIVSPPNAPKPRDRKWRFTFLQHGVIQSDLSRWLNMKSPSLVVTSTPAEYESMAGDGTPYLVTPRETVLTGQPRHDALLAKARAVDSGARRAVVFMPTWRRNLLGDPLDGGNLRALLPGFWESEYVTKWFGLVRSESLKEAATRHGFDIIWMVHPNLAPHITSDRLPDHVRTATYDSVDVQEVLAHAALVISDYSSVIFDAALIDCAVMYFQFDREEFVSGGHIGRPGYFDYDRDGFGPVARTLDDAEATLMALVNDGFAVGPEYAARARAAFTMRDGRASERIFEEIMRRRGEVLPAHPEPAATDFRDVDQVAAPGAPSEASEIC